MPAGTLIPSLLLLAGALTAPALAHDGHHIEAKALPGSWYHAPDHPAYKLFRRGQDTDGTNYATVGTPGPSPLSSRVARA